ncbi:MAG: hypothetical protein OWR62_01550 [Sulfobacillus thermotolerans]|uniref:DUF433 domain-containing protein n=1 Tax=Sulfobacillus thermotolerans TaxID=338644 RepID=A0ABM6RQB4_9FIRM|nr:hypothetical protein BXT84_06340 [Sulfobacillus thermotolerans]MCY0907055.1 hypothetical protein [Sulfobacillus thermotolerans]
MDENELRLDYWVATRTNPKFPLWVIFKEIGHRDGQGEAYGRRSLRPVREMLRDLEDSEWIPKAAEGLAVPEQELRAALWYAIWLLDQKEPPSEWKEWNDKVDEAWRKGWR